MRRAYNMFILYDILYLLFLLAYLPVMVLRGKYHGGLWTRLGFVNVQKLGLPRAGVPVLWLHAVSVGEVQAVGGLIAKIKGKYPGYSIVLSTVTPTGFNLAQTSLGDKACVIYAPLDFSWAVGAYIRCFQPKVYVTAETEIWPNLFSALFRQGVPIIQVNGRISTESYGRYKRIRPILKRTLKNVSLFCMQSPEDAERIVGLGADKEKVCVVGNMKFDGQAAGPDYQRKEIGIAADEIVWVAGSTHDGEENIVLRVFRGLKGTRAALRLIIAPRHIERAGHVMTMVEQHGYFPVRFSQLSGTPLTKGGVIVIDTIGDLRRLYGIADIVFMGKSLTAHGGQNMLEPIFYGKPVIVGPFTENFQHVVELLRQGQAILQVRSEEDLGELLKQLIKDPDFGKKIGAQAARIIGRNQGATGKTLARLEPYIPAV